MITSTKNPRIIELRKLSQRKHRQRQNRFVVEGLQLLGLALDAAAKVPQKVIPLEVFYNEELFTGDVAPRLLAQLIQAGAQAYPVAPHVLDSLSERDTSQGLLATFALRELEYTLDELEQVLPQFSDPLHLSIRLRFALHQAQDVLRATGDTNLQSPNPSTSLRTSLPVSQSFDFAQDKPPNLPISQSPNLPPSLPLLLILDQLQDPGNLGTLIRTADAVGAAAVILLEPCVDPFDPKTVRGTMGSLFTVPLARTAGLVELLAKLSAWGYRPVGADAQRGQLPWQSDVLAGPVALVLGNEARGLSPELHPHLTGYVALPLLGQAESLNVAVAGGVLMYEWLRANWG